MAENAFPVHPVDVVVRFYKTEVLLGEEAKHFNKSDLAPSPKPEAVQLLYMRVLHQLFPFRAEYHSMVTFVENIQCPESYEGATGILCICSQMQQFLPMCLVYDFSLNDLLAPKKQRTLSILSAIMNFLQFRKQRIDVMSAKEAKFRAALDMQQTLAKGNMYAVFTLGKNGWGCRGASKHGPENEPHRHGDAANVQFVARLGFKGL